MILLVDTSEFESVRFAAVGVPAGKLSGKIFDKTYTTGRNQSHRTLGFLERFLKSAKIQRDGIDALYVVNGSGSFNGIRAGVSMCMALSFAWGIPLFSIEKVNIPASLALLPKAKKKKVSSSNVQLDYGAAPNITPAKKKF